MGCSASFEDIINCGEEGEGKDNLNIATLNYSSDSMTPFEFYSLDHYLEETEFDAKVKEMISNDKTLNLTIVKIFDFHIKPRYSPLYDHSFGVRDYRFEDKQKFKQTWLKQFLAGAKEKKMIEVIEDLKKEKEQEIGFSVKQLDVMRQGLTESEWEEIDTKAVSEKAQNILSIINEVRNFDYIVFECILKYVYGTNSVEVIFKNRGVAKYLGFMERFFQKPFLNESMKESRIIDFIVKKNIDVLFLQNVTTSFCQNFTKKMPNYRLKRGVANSMQKQEKKQKKQERFCNSAIIIKPSSFRKAYSGKKGNLKFRDILQDVGISKQIKENFLKWKGTETAIESIGNFILISFDAKNKGKVEDPKKDFKQFVDHLNVLKERFPKKYIVIGGVFDSFLFADDDQYLKKINLQKYPNVNTLRDTQYMTCHNVRTYLMSFFKDLENNEKLSEKINHPICRNFLVFPIRMNKPSVGSPAHLELVTTLPKKIDRGIYMSQDEMELQQNYFEDLSREFQDYERNKQMHISRNELGYLPNRKHPFNEYFVAMNLRVPRRKEKKSEKDENDEVVSQDLDYDEKRPFESSSSESEQSEVEVDNNQRNNEND